MTLTSEVNPDPIIQNINPDYLLSFNYTHTFQKVYDNKEIPCCYIHGECRQLDSTKSKFENNRTSNIVLGIDEYLDSYKRDEANRFAIFKKFVQRIRNHDDTRYHQWAEESAVRFKRSQVQSSKKSGYFKNDYTDVYIYGHSLDITDRDILQQFMQPDWSCVHIYAYDKTAEGDLIEKSINIMSEETVIRKSCEDRIGYELLSTKL